MDTCTNLNNKYICAPHYAIPADVGEVRIAINADKPEIGTGKILHKYVSLILINRSYCVGGIFCVSSSSSAILAGFDIA